MTGLKEIALHQEDIIKIVLQDCTNFLIKNVGIKNAGYSFYGYYFGKLLKYGDLNRAAPCFGFKPNNMGNMLWHSETQFNIVITIEEKADKQDAFPGCLPSKIWTDYEGEEQDDLFLTLFSSERNVNKMNFNKDPKNRIYPKRIMLYFGKIKY